MSANRRQNIIKLFYDWIKVKIYLDKRARKPAVNEGEIFEYDWKFNLSRGAIAKKVENKFLANRLEKLAKRVCDETNLKFGSIDIIETNNKMLVLEVNSGVMIENYIKLNPDEYGKVKEIYKEAIQSLFEY